MSKTINTYNESAGSYEQRWAAYLRHTHDKFLKYLELSETDHILDLSCGTGLLAREIQKDNRPFQRMVLNDPAEEMLDIARSRFSSHPNISFSNAPAHKLSFEDNSFTRIISLNAFHNYEHQQKVIEEVHRLLKSGGRFYLQDWNRIGLFRPVNTLIRWWVPEYIDTRSLSECRQMLKEQGFMTEQEQSWRYRYWKFFYLQARLTDVS